MATLSSLTLALRDDMRLTEEPGGALVLSGPYGNVPIRQTSPGWRMLLRRLAEGGASEAELGRVLVEQDGPAAAFSFHTMLRRLVEGGLVRQTLLADGRPAATLLPTGAGLGRPAAPLAEQHSYQLSRFACLRARAGQLLAETPLSANQVILHTPAAAALVSGALLQPRTPAELAGLAGELDPAGVRTLLEFLLRAALLVRLDDDGASPEERDPALGQWEFHDLLFHSRTRLGRHNNPYGGAMPGKARFAPLPVAKAYPEAPAVALPQPDLAALARDDMSLTSALEQRRSVRAHAGDPLSLEQLGALLYRSARLKQAFQSEDQLAMSRRPYPAGGALYELEIYPVVQRCAGLEPGIYHYQAQRHQLSRLAEPGPAVQQLLGEAAAMAQMPGPPQVLLAITARFQRVQWKYSSLAYALILKHVGALYQTMYLVATAMGLAPCALGGGNSDLFAAAAGLDYYAETSVGEFLLGTPAEG